MPFALTSPVTGAPMTAFTLPTYTILADTPPEINAKQFVVSALGGTQTGVIAHTIAAPFTTAMFRPKQFALLQPVNAVTGILNKVPKNTSKVITRKGVLPLAGQAFSMLLITTTIECPAGADTADPANIKAALSMHIGSLSQVSAGVGDTTLNGIL